MQIHNSAGLKAAIHQLEQKQFIQKEALIDQFHETYESLKPLNIVKSEFKKITNSITGSSETKGTILKTALGLGVGFLTKKIFFRGPTNILKRLIGTAVEAGVAKLVAVNADKIVEKGVELKDKGLEILHASSRDGRVL
ncbi:MAG TPA: hypothetical protein VK559_08320 [Ferruginibacter sp.]|nr:hypothetical protein [Ferruginibacter sp.]